MRRAGASRPFAIVEVSSFSDQPFVTIGGGALPLPLPMPTHPETLAATRVATSAIRTFFIVIPSAGPCTHTGTHCNTIWAGALVLESHSPHPNDRRATATVGRVAAVAELKPSNSQVGCRGGAAGPSDIGTI